MDTLTITRADFKRDVDAFISSHVAGDEPTVPSSVILSLTQHEDPTPRDYLMGAVRDYDLPLYIEAMQAISRELPAGNRRAVACVLSALKAEIEDTDSAIAYAFTALQEDKEYSLGQLLMRAYMGNFAPRMFAQMRLELHDKLISSMDGTEI